MLSPTLHIQSPSIQRTLRAYTVNGHTFHTVQVQKGRFWMGDDLGHDDEKPAHWVDLAQDFEIGQHPVTQALWEAVMGSNPAYFKGGTRPLESVSWDDINRPDGFLERLNTLPAIKKTNEKDGHHFALPTEAQWEYAAQGGRYRQDVSCQYAGSNYLSEVGWYNDNIKEETQSAGRKLPNALGLHDMSGNVWEWCEDILITRKGYLGAPRDGSARIKGDNEPVRAVRGGAWGREAKYCRTFIRTGYYHFVPMNSVGFRLARSKPRSG